MRDRITQRSPETTININGRAIVARRVSQQMIWFEFSDICGGPRSPSDYIAIAGEYATVFISSIPQFDRATAVARSNWGMEEMKTVAYSPAMAM